MVRVEALDPGWTMEAYTAWLKKYHHVQWISYPEFESDWIQWE